MSESQFGHPDAVIIGAGIMGCAIALELGRRNLTVQVIDSGQGPASGSTSFSAANLRFHYSTLDGVLASWESKHIWDRWGDYLECQDTSGLAVLQPLGLLRLEPADSSRRRTVLELYDTVGVPYSELDSATIRQSFPAIDPGLFGPAVPVGDETFWSEPKGELPGFLNPDCGFIDDPQRAAQNLMTAAEASGARFAFGVSAVEIQETSGGRGLRIRLDNGQQVEAPVVVNAAGPHSGYVNKMAGVEDDFKQVWTRPLRMEIHRLPAPVNFTLESCRLIIDDPDLCIWARPHFGDVLLIGGMEPACDPLDWVADASQYDHLPSLPAWEAQVFRTGRRLPGLRVEPRPTGYAALYDVTPDWIPIYDRTSLRGFYVAIGTSGNQFKNAPLVGRMMAELICACENGHDHDSAPIKVRGEITGQDINVGHYSRLREVREGMTVSG